MEEEQEEQKEEEKDNKKEEKEDKTKHTTRTCHPLVWDCGQELNKPRHPCLKPHWRRVREESLEVHDMGH